MSQSARLFTVLGFVSAFAIPSAATAQSTSSCASVICGTGNAGLPIGITTGMSGTIGTPAIPPMPTLESQPPRSTSATISSGVINDGSSSRGYGPGAGGDPVGAAGFGPVINPSAEASTYAGPNAGSISYGSGTNPATGGGLFTRPSSTPPTSIVGEGDASRPSVLPEALGPGFGSGISPKSGLEPPPPTP